MKSKCLPLLVVLVLNAGAFLPTSTASAPPVLRGGDPTIVKINWGNPMPVYNGEMCVDLQANNTALLNFIFSINQYFTPTMPVARIKYRIVTPTKDVTYFSDPIDNGSLVQGVLNGYNVLQSTLSVNIPMDIECNNSSSFCLAIYWQLVKPDPGATTGYSEYPINSYYSHWPTYIFPENGFPGQGAPLYSIQKEACCYGSTGDGVVCSPIPLIAPVGEDLIVETSRTEQKQTAEGAPSAAPVLISNDITVSPNPFTDEVSILYSLSNRQQAKIELLDLNGKVLSVRIETALRDGAYHTILPTTDFAPGLYYLRLSTDNWSKVNKLVKISR